MNQIKAGAILSYVSLFLTTFLGIVYTPFMLRYMGQSEFGLYSLAASVIAYLTLFDFGFGNAVVRFTAKFRAEGKVREQYEMFGMFLILYCGIALLASVAGYCLWVNAESMFGSAMTPEELLRAKLILALLVGNLAFTFPLTIFRSIITAYEDFIFQRVLSIARILLQTAIMIPLLLWGYKAVALSVLITILNLATLFADTAYCFKKLKIKIYFTNMRWGLLKEISGYSFYVFLGIIADRIYCNSGQFILGMTSGTTATAIYAVAARLVGFYIAISTAIPCVLLPKITTLVVADASRQEISNVFTKVGRIQFLVLGVVFTGFIVFGRYFVALWAGSPYESAYLLTIVLMAAFLPDLIQNTSVPILQARNKLRFRSLVYSLVSVLSVGVGYKLSFLYGEVGCAIGIALALLIGNGLVMNFYYHKALGIRIVDFWRQIFKMSFPFWIVGGGAFLIELEKPSDCIVTYIMRMFVFLFILIPAIWWFSMNQYERDLICRPLFKMVNIIRLRRGRRS